MIINEVELPDIDIFEADVAEKYEQVLENVSVEAKKLKGLKTSKMIREQCSLVFNCFNALFGPGTDKKVFGDKVNLLICLKAFEQLVENVNSKKEEMDKLINKYTPNRALRK